MKEKSNRPDFSMYLAHFTKDGKFCNDEQREELNPILGQDAKQRLFSILRQKKIFASKMPWTGLPCVCYTECPWSSLLAHTAQYSPYGIGFNKEFIFNHNGAPALYVRVNIFNKLRKKKVKSKLTKEENELWVFTTPFSPIYGSSYTKKLLKRWVDYSHEREWRTPKDLDFQYDDLAFIILKSICDYESMPMDIKSQIENANVKIIIMDNYRLIEELWPVHKINESHSR